MGHTEPVTELDARYGDDGVTPTPWSDVERLLTAAELYWLTTIRPTGGPHQTPLIGLYHGGALHFCTGPDEAKAQHIARTPKVVMSTGVNTLHAGTDVVVEGEAVRVVDDGRLGELAAAWEEKYGEFWRFEVRNGGFQHGAGHAFVFSVAPRTVFGFGKGEPFSQTRWRFD